MRLVAAGLLLAICLGISNQATAQRTTRTSRNKVTAVTAYATIWNQSHDTRSFDTYLKKFDVVKLIDQTSSLYLLDLPVADPPGYIWVEVTTSKGEVYMKPHVLPNPLPRKKGLPYRTVLIGAVSPQLKGAVVTIRMLDIDKLTRAEGHIKIVD